MRYLPAAELEQCLPEVATRIDLASRALIALSRGDAEMPPKIGVHPRPGALLHAMPAWLRDGDLVGMKWVAAFPGNAERGISAINGLIVLNDAETGVPMWLMGAARVTAVRTAAVSGLAIRLLAPASVESVAILGAGVQARSHTEVISVLMPATTLRIYDRHPARADAVAAEARGQGLAASTASSAREATEAAQVVITAATLGSMSQAMALDWLLPGALVVSIDFATYASAELANSARLFATDDREQFLSYRQAGYFDGFPDPTTTIGELADGRAATPLTDDRPVHVNHLGVGLADVVFADAITRRAEELGLGAELAP
jgi:ornithine cyclodeaminase/alanine dehydrogenase-like protein (mu-crystallin family)